MSLIEIIRQNQLEARKNKNVERLSVLQVVLSVLKNESIAKQKELSDEEIVESLQKQVKQLNDAMQDFVAGKRQDLIDKTNKEISVVKEFLPEQMSEEDVSKEVQKVISDFGEVSPSDLGKVIGLSMSKLKGKTDGTTVSRIVKQILTK
ncbi:MAG: GatB/YqeY protein [uncultured bacterium]|nr:MAG: GatB/YqeY protein [uncultured bacterium]OGH83698.1 MAG: hypothetical protein A2488_02405 [Candidatus Magasanikbacteria bacterium RIFOXYC12_FULL_32_21b]OGH88878.1 MAG: hypothetical protein A2507_03235 [Candidatus Magasanikbacteria bacterium RIFOXYD12_FULL_33_17]HAO52542.1 hypothetical protein [Candidatus Magasanikbacteria bacterium]